MIRERMVAACPHPATRYSVMVEFLAGVLSEWRPQHGDVPDLSSWLNDLSKNPSSVLAAASLLAVVAEAHRRVRGFELPLDDLRAREPEVVAALPFAEVHVS